MMPQGRARVMPVGNNEKELRQGRTCVLPVRNNENYAKVEHVFSQSETMRITPR